MSLYRPISPVFIKNTSLDAQYVILYDPTEVYSRIKIDPFKRRQSLTMGELFPNEKGFCACGCGLRLTGRSTRWRETSHADKLISIMGIIQGDSGLIKQLMQAYAPLSCAKCGKEDYEVVRYGTGYRGIQYVSYAASGIHVDHIISVKNGGGGCWLGNYQFLCHTCNIQKERTDRLLRNIQPAMPISTLF